MKKISLFIITLSLIAGESFAQYEKFKSKTKFDRKKEAAVPSDEDFEEDDGFDEKEKKPAKVLVNKIKNKTNKGNFFGRKEVKLPDDNKDPKYVNLNPETAFGPEVVKSFDFPNTTLVDLTKHMQKMHLILMLKLLSK